MYNDIIYDFDGTLSDTYPVFADCFLELLKNHGMESDYETVYKQLKVTIAHAMSCYDFGDIPKKELSKEYHELHQSVALDVQKPINGALEILEFAVKNGKRNYLYTRSGGIATELCQKWGMDKYFTYIIDANSPFKPKPCPDALNWLCEEYGIDKEHALMVGDRDLDTDVGENAGLKTCLLDVERLYTHLVVDHRIESLKELEDIMMN